MQQPAHPSWRRYALVALVVSAVYAAMSGPFITQPSPHFHFTDLANSFLHGRVDTDTPRRHARGGERPGDPPGYMAAIARATDNGKNGWNDWASYRVLVLKGGQEVRGVFPFLHDKGPKKKEFWTVDGKSMVIDVHKDLKKGCNPNRPHARCDRVEYKVSFPPFPAVVLMPLVAVIGYNTNDVIVTLLFGALSAVLLLMWLARLRREGLIHHSRADQLWLVAMFAFGTVAFYCAIRGAVWFTALTMGVTLHFGYLLAAQGARRPLLAGLLFGLGVATRTPILFAGVFFPLEALFKDGRWLGGLGREGATDAAKRIALFALPAATIGLVLAYYNYVRWQNPLEFGHFYLLEGTRAPTRDHGLFNFYFLNHNLSAALTNLPRLSLSAPYLQITRHGLGILACTPALFALFGGAVVHPSDEAGPQSLAYLRRRSLVRNLAISIVCVALPALIYQNDGWQQFGYRFALDFWPALIGLFALRVGRLSPTVKALIIVGIIVQTFGAVTFGRMEWFYYD
ncbi:MAG: hypothetical protein KC502_04430 [Myxococcales bacterium]|nr:hypothetical protein [Myxococcales bacterium]